jgi:hypothetical protein
MTTVVACPSCQRNVQVPHEMLEQLVACPECGQTFTPTQPGSFTSAPSDRSDVPEWDKPPQPSGEADEEFASPLEDEPDDAERPKRKRAKSKSSSTYDDLMKRQLKRAKANPHRGVLILVFGIVAIVFACAPFVGLTFGILAWNWGTNDLNEMESGRMDPDGRTLSNVGRILGLVGAGLCCLLMLVNGVCCLVNMRSLRF